MAGYRLVVTKSIELVAEVIEVFYGNASLSLEGQLNDKDFSAVEGITTEPTEVLTRNTQQPHQDFIILPVEENTRDVIKRFILPQVGLRRNINHLLMEKEGLLVFAAYDKFHPGSVWITDKVREDWLEGLLQLKIIKSFEKVN